MFPYEKDDQKWVNYALYRMDVRWPNVAKGKRMFDAGAHSPTTIGRVSSLGLRVALMDPMVIVRKCYGAAAKATPRLVVEHCYIPRGNDKLAALKQRHTWYLRERVRDVVLRIDARNMTRAEAWNIVLEKVRPEISDRGS